MRKLAFRFLFLSLGVFLFAINGFTAFAAGVVGNGTSASCTEGALDAVLVGGGSVTFNCGNVGATITLSTWRFINTDTTIDGGGKITINGNGVTRFANIGFNTNVILENLNFMNGFNNGPGGILTNFGNLTINNSNFRNNKTTQIYSGGVIYSDGILNISNSYFTNNTAKGLGGVLSMGYNAQTTINQSLFQNNAAANEGGAIYAYGPVSITNSTFIGNVSLKSGGAVAVGGGTTMLTNNTFSANNAIVSGGSLYNAGTLYDPNGANVHIVNTIVDNSTPSNCAGTMTSLGTNIDSGSSCNFSAFGDRSNVDPLLGPLANNGGRTKTMALLTGSPAIDMANSLYCPMVDQRGFARGNVCDIGAFEL